MLHIWNQAVARTHIRVQPSSRGWLLLCTCAMHHKFALESCGQGRIPHYRHAVDPLYLFLLLNLCSSNRALLWLKMTFGWGWLFCILHFPPLASIWCVLRGSMQIDLNKEHFTSVHYESNSFWRMERSQNEFGPQWTEIQCSSCKFKFTFKHNLRACTTSGDFVFDNVCRTTNRTSKEINSQRKVPLSWKETPDKICWNPWPKYVKVE